MQKYISDVKKKETRKKKKNPAQEHVELSRDTVPLN